MATPDGVPLSVTDLTNEREADLFRLYLDELSSADRLIELYQWRERNPGVPLASSTYVAMLGEVLVGAITTVPVWIVAGGQRLKAAWQQDSLVTKAVRGLRRGFLLLPLPSGERALPDIPRSGWLGRVRGSMRQGRRTSERHGGPQWLT